MLEPTLIKFDAMLPPKTTAEILGVETQTLAAWRSNKRVALPWVKCGAAVRYKASDVQRFIEKNTVTPTQIDG